MRAPRLRSAARVLSSSPVLAVHHDAEQSLTGTIDAQRLLLPAVQATLAGLRGRQVLDIGGRAGLIGGTPVIRAADPLRLPWPAAYFDAILSLDLLGLLAPEELRLHVTEAARVLRPGGRFICVVAEHPSVIFTAGGADPDQVRRDLERALADTTTPEQISAAMLAVPGILRATVILADQSPVIPSPDERIPPGTIGWTRLPEAVVRHRLYGVDDVLRATQGARLSAVSVERHVDPTAGRVGSALGPAYRMSSPFAMVHLVRREGRVDSLRPRLSRGSAEVEDAITLAP